MNDTQFIEKYCHKCGTQRCEGIGTEWFEGCPYRWNHDSYDAATKIEHLEKKIMELAAKLVASNTESKCNTCALSHACDDYDEHHCKENNYRRYQLDKSKCQVILAEDLYDALDEIMSPDDALLFRDIQKVAQILYEKGRRK